MILRRIRSFIKGFSIKGVKGLFFKSGDVLRVNFLRAGQGFFFEGLCLAIKKKSLSHKDSSLLLRNLVGGSGIEIKASYYYHRLYGLAFSDFRRKRYHYMRSKLYYLRARVAKHTFV